MADVLQTKCDACNEIALEPYIECNECEVSLCTSCFASGQELNQHKNDHKYSVRKNDFPLFDNCNWSAKEECKLLSALFTFGYGNWEEISKNVHTRTKLECQEHYKKYYVENAQNKELASLLPETEQSVFPKPIIPYLYNTKISFNPPRNNHADPHIAGYNAYRSEFELNYDHNAESLLSIENNFIDNEDECVDALKIALVNAMTTRLKERQRRYKIIQEHGLIMPNKLLSWLQRYDSTLSRSKSEKLLCLMQFMTGMQFVTFLESLSLEMELTQRIMRLTEYRRNGIRTLYGVGLYESLKLDHEVTMKEQKHATMVMSKKFDRQSPCKYKNMGKISQRKFKKRCPLEIVDFPGFEHLSDSEKNLCSDLRLLPKNYLEIKSQLKDENDKIGSLKLLDARRIIKIDVNKTRKIYDHLVSEGHICKQR